jgi:hypothetical protein
MPTITARFFTCALLNHLAWALTLGCDPDATAFV